MTRRFRAASLGGLALSLAFAGLLALSPPFVSSLRSVGEDLLLVHLTPDIGPSPVTVVDIGAKNERGADWTRSDTARLLLRLHQSGAGLVAVDMVFSGDCGSEGAARLQIGLGQGPTVLGFLLSDDPGTSVPPGAVLARDDVLPGLWQAPGAELPCPALLGGSTSLGAISLTGVQSSAVRTVPVAVLAGGSLQPSLAVEASRRWLGQDRIALTGGLAFADRTLVLSAPGFLQITPESVEEEGERTIRADAVLGGLETDLMIKDRLVLVGSSLPSRGGLRATATSPLTPSVQIQAGVIEQILAGWSPHRPVWAALAEAGFLALSGGLLLLRAGRSRPLVVLGAGGALCLVWALGTTLTYRATSVLLDPALPAAMAALTVTLTIAAQSVAHARAESSLRLRMAQHLPAQVVAELVDHPDRLRLKGERREVTALFTDLEGFSDLANRTDAEALISSLDGYFAGISDVILRHGGMIDKLVGDAVHALFNAPIDLPDHAERAIDAALAIAALPRPPGFGRTRIGVELGIAVVGDVGSGAKIDYTAHGPCVNLAARLQELARGREVSIILGPDCAKRSRRTLTDLGEVEVRSFGTVRIYSPESTV